MKARVLVATATGTCPTCPGATLCNRKVGTSRQKRACWPQDLTLQGVQKGNRYLGVDLLEELGNRPGKCGSSAPQPRQRWEKCITFLLSSEARSRALSALPSPTLNVSACGSLDCSLCWPEHHCPWRSFRLCLALAFRYPVAV